MPQMYEIIIYNINAGINIESCGGFSYMKLL